MSNVSLKKAKIVIRTEKGLEFRRGYTFVDVVDPCSFCIGVYKEHNYWVLMDCDTGMRLNMKEYKTRNDAIDDYFNEWGERLYYLAIKKPTYDNYYSKIRREFSELLQTEKEREKDNHMVVFQSRDVVQPFALELEFQVRGHDSIYFEALLHHVDIRTNSKTARFSGNGEDILHVIDLICRQLRSIDGLDFETSDEVQIENEVAEFLAERF